MKVEKLLKKLASWLGVQFLPDNTILPVFWWWGRYRETKAPNHLGIVFTIPLLEKCSRPIKTFRTATVKSAGLYSQDCVPLTIKLFLLYRFDPRSLRGRWATGAQMVRLPEHVLEQIVTDQAVRHLRRIVSDFTAEEVLRGSTQKRLERWLVKCLNEQLGTMGLMLDGDGAQITDIRVPEQFERAKLGAICLQNYVRTVHNCDERAVNQALDAEAVSRADGSTITLLNWSRASGGNGAASKDLSPLALASLLYKGNDGS